MKYGFTVSPGKVDLNLEYAVRFNFKILEISFPQIISPESIFNNKHAEYIRKFSAENYIRTAFHLPFNLDLANPNPELRNRGISFLKECIKTASMLGAAYITIHPGLFYWFPFSDEMRNRGLEKLTESLREVLPLCNNYNIKLALENQYPLPVSSDFYYLGDYASDFAFIFSQVTDSMLKMCLDTGHANLAEGFEIYIRQFSKKILNVHINDNLGFYDDHNLPGEGSINWSYFNMLLKDEEINTSFIAQCPDYKPHEVIKRLELMMHGEVVQAI